MTNQQDNGAGAARNVVGDAATGKIAVPGKTLKDLVALQQTEIARALPGALDASRYVRIVQTELRKNPNLMKCSPASFLGAVITAAQLGLEFGPLGQAYLVPYKDNCTLIVGYKGWLSLAYRSEQIASISARAVHEKDTFSYQYGLNESLIHIPFDGDRGGVTRYYCVGKTIHEGVAFEVMSMDEMLAHRERYAKKVNGSFVGPWKDNFDEMARKTVFLKVKTWLPQSTAMAEATGVDGAVITRNTIDDEPEISYDIEGEIID